MIEIVSILILTGIASIGIRYGLGKLRATTALPEWLRTLADAFYSPAPWLIWGYGILVLLEVLSRQGDFAITGAMMAKIRSLCFVTGAAWVILSWKVRFQKLLLNRAASHDSPQNEKVLIIGVSKIINVAVFVVAMMVILEAMGVPLASLMAFGGVGAATIGFAGKDVFANFFGGMMIHINQPFTLGDWIMSPNKKFEGVVEEIGWYMTRIRTFARRPTYIPNAMMTDAIVENPGRMYNRRIKTTLALRYCDIHKVEKVVSDIEAMLKSHPDIDHRQFLFVHFVAFGTHSIDLEVYCFTKTTVWKEYRDIQQQVYLKMASIIEANGAEFAFPTQTLHLDGSTTVAEPQPV